MRWGIVVAVVCFAAPLSGAPRNFTNAGTVAKFTGGAALKEKKLLTKKTWGGSTADASMTIAGFDMKGWLQTPKATFPFAAAHVARTIWAPGRVGVLQYLGAMVVLDTQTGKVVYQREGKLECDARFVGDTLWAHEESKDPKARLWKIDLKTNVATAVTAGRRVDQCVASADAQKWILYDEYAKDSKLMLMSAAGKLDPLAHGDMDSVTLSPAGDRACFVRNLSVFCIRDDHTEERIATDISGASLEIEPSGARMLIQAFYSVKGNSVPVMLLADFASGSVREIRGPALKSGGSVHLLAGGKSIASGSASGVEVYDVEAGTRHALKHNAMYSVHALLGAERKLIGEEDNGGDTYVIELP
jgi:hypothetical protein